MLEKFRPSRDRLLIKRCEEEERTPGGIIKPDTAKTKGQTGEVLAVGQGRMNKDGDFIPVQIKPGDLVFFGKYSGTEIDDEHLILGEDDILGVVGK